MNTINKKNKKMVKSEQKMPETKQAQTSKKKKASKTKLIVILSLVGVLIVAAAVAFVVFKNDIAYTIANAKLNNGDDISARQMFLDLGDFEDSSEKVQQIDYINACKRMDKKEYQAAISQFKTLGEYSDCKSKVIQCHGLLAQQQFESEDFENARVNFKTAGDTEGVRKTDSLWGDKLYAGNDFEGALTRWKAYAGDPEMDEKIKLAEYEIAIAAAQSGDFSAVIKANNLNVDDRAIAAAKAFLIMPLEKTVPIAASTTHIAYITLDGSVHADGSNSHTQCDVDGWEGVVSLCLSELNTYGLRYDGTVLATGSNTFGQCDVSSWQNIVALAATDNAVFGLTSEGRVLYTGGVNGWYDASSEWTDIIEISAGMEHIVALDSSGNVYAAGKNHYGQLNVSEAKDISSIACGPLNTILINNEGALDIIGVDIDLGSSHSLTGIVSASSTYSHIVLKMQDGTMCAYGENGRRQCEVSSWTDILHFTADGTFTVGVKSDGSVLNTVEGHTLDWQVFVWN